MKFTPPRGVLCLLLGALLLMVAGGRHARLVDLRDQFQLQAVPPEDTTPLVALTTVAFGGFRGLVADLLWVRAATLQEEGQYFELVQLAKWISQLEPRIPEVWSYQSWNLAYNIGALFPNHEDRWRWVRHGIDLLRRQGLAHNPASPSLHWDIGWMFQHKIGMRFDEAHPVYRRKLAADIEALLPEGLLPENPPPALRHALRDTFVMDLDTLRELDTQYGPIDWRIPEAHSLYWATRGLPLADTRFIQRALRRMRITGLRTLMWKGRLAGNPSQETSIPLPRPELVPILQHEFRSLLDTSDDRTLLRSYQAFLTDALLLRAEFGQHEQAYDLYRELAEIETSLPPGEAGFRQWTESLWRQDPATLRPDHAHLRVAALLLRARTHQKNHPALASELLDQARQTHRLYQQSLATPELRTRNGLPDFDRLRQVLIE